MIARATTIFRNNMRRAGFGKTLSANHMQAFRNSTKTLAKLDLHIDHGSLIEIPSLKIGITSDHAGCKLKGTLTEALTALNSNFMDFGPFAAPKDKLDYPAFAATPLDLVRFNELDRAILICGTGMGMEIIANKFPDIRGALAGHPKSIVLARRHSNINTIAFGEWSSQSLTLIYDNLLAFLLGNFLSEGPNYGRRLDEVEVISMAARANPQIPLYSNCQLDKAVAENPHLTQIWASSAMHLISSGKTQEAIELLDKYMKKGKLDPNRRENLEQIKTLLAKLEVSQGSELFNLFMMAIDNELSA